MKITSSLFDAFLKCATKCHLRSLGEIGSGNEYAEWVRDRDESYQREAALRMQEAVPETERAVRPPATENLKAAKWRLAADLLAQTPDRSADCQALEPGPNEGTGGLAGPRSEQLLESHLHAVERVPSEGRGKPAQFVPIRFVFRNKLTKDDRLLLAFDALVLSQLLGRVVGHGKIIHGDDHVTLKVKTSALTAEVRKRLDKVAALLSSPAPPDLILNRQCAECEFQARCRKIAVEKDDLSLLATMSAKERQELRGKGIFTVTQLSYPFRPRRRPKRLRDKREKYHHSLKALAIREKKIHIVGSPELKIDGTPVYLDVEGLPDRDFYYLIGLRIGNGDSAVQHSLWADTIEDEGKIWREFLGILETIEKPVLIHYGSYETDFLSLMGDRHGRPPENSDPARAIETSVNVLSVAFAQVYFPTFTNGLKDIAGFLGFNWSEAGVSGLQTIMRRHTWENAASQELQQKLRNYNEEDCHALEIVTRAMWRLGTPEQSDKQPEICSIAVVHTELLPHQTMWPRFSSPFPEFEQVNKAARWDHQRDKVYVRSSKRLRKIAKRTHSSREGSLQINRHVVCPDVPICPTCGTKGFRHYGMTSKIVHDVFFGKAGIKRSIVEYRFRVRWCPKCRVRFAQPKGLWYDSKYGRNLVALFIYQFIELGIPQRTVWQSIRRLTGLHLYSRLMPRFKESAMEFYQETRRLTLDRIRRGGLVHVDETRANVRGRTGYVWIFTNLHEVAYLYSDSREGDLVHGILRGFGGVLVSDFYSAYDSLDCPQQKCLIHLMRDLNAEVLSNPYDEQLKRIVRAFAELLKPMVETVDQHGLKKYFLNKHIKFVDQFYKQLGRMNLQSEPALRCKERFKKNRHKLFTFLEHDGIPWNNNNAEHAVKAFAALRKVMEGSSTQKGLEEYLVLLSVCQTCKYMGVDFLDFLRSGEKDIHAFAESRRGRRRQPQPLSG